MLRLDSGAVYDQVSVLIPFHAGCLILERVIINGFEGKRVDETKKSKPPEANRHHNSRKLLILLPLRAI